MLCLLDQIIKAFITGLFGALGAATPVALILYILFLATRKTFRVSIDEDRKILNKYEENLCQTIVMISDIQAHIDAGVTDDTPVGKDLFSMKNILNESRFKYELEVVKRTIYIKKIEDASFLNWVGYYFTKSYLADYFRR